VQLFVRGAPAAGKIAPRLRMHACHACYRRASATCEPIL